MRKLELNFCTRAAMGPATRVYDGPGIRIAMGGYTSVDLDGVAVFVFDAGVPWSEPKSLAGKTAHELRAETVAAALPLLGDGHVLDILRGLRNAHDDGVQHGRDAMACDLRELLGVRS